MTMIDIMMKAKYGEERPTLSALEVAKNIWFHEGRWLFFKGIASGVVKSIPGGVVLTVYDRLQSINQRD